MGETETVNPPADAYAREIEWLSDRLHISKDVVQHEAIALLGLVAREIIAGNMVVVHRRCPARWRLPLLGTPLGGGWKLRELRMLTLGPDASDAVPGDERGQQSTATGLNEEDAPQMSS